MTQPVFRVNMAWGVKVGGTNLQLTANGQFPKPVGSGQLTFTGNDDGTYYYSFTVDYPEVPADAGPQLAVVATVLIPNYNPDIMKVIRVVARDNTVDATIF